MTFGEKLRALRRRKGISQVKAAEVLDLRQTDVSDIELGKNHPTVLKQEGIFARLERLPDAPPLS